MPSPRSAGTAPLPDRFRERVLGGLVRTVQEISLVAQRQKVCVRGARQAVRASRRAGSGWQTPDKRLFER
jgi:hypothetical protein